MKLIKLLVLYLICMTNNQLLLAETSVNLHEEMSFRLHARPWKGFKLSMVLSVR